MQDEIGRFYITKKPNDTTNARIIVHANSNKMFKRISYVFFFFNTEIHEDFIKNYFKSIHISVN